IEVADLDEDHLPDLVTLDPSQSRLLIFFQVTDGSGDRFFRGVDLELAHQRRNPPVDLRIVDLNEDGHPDVLTENLFNSISVYLNQGPQEFARDGSLKVGELPRDIAVGDLNRDGVLDFATANRETDDLSVLLSR